MFYGLLSINYGLKNGSLSFSKWPIKGKNFVAHFHATFHVIRNRITPNTDTFYAAVLRLELLRDEVWGRCSF